MIELFDVIDFQDENIKYDTGVVVSTDPLLVVRGGGELTSAIYIEHIQDIYCIPHKNCSIFKYGDLKDGTTIMLLWYVTTNVIRAYNPIERVSFRVSIHDVSNIRDTASKRAMPLVAQI